MKVAYISVYNTECGIATYNQALIDALRQYADVKIFAEYNGQKNTNNITYCWKRTDWPQYQLIDAIDEYKPDIIQVSHEYGLFPNAYQYTSLISYFKWKKYKVVTTFHSVYKHLDKTVQEASSPNIIVHTDEAKNCLIEKGIKRNNIHVIPHGISYLDDSDKLLSPLWNTWGNEYTIFQPGFLFYYKGHFNMLDIIYDLKKKYPNVHYIVQASENPKCIDEHNKVYNELMAKVKQLDLLSNVTINRGFASMEVLLSYIRTVKCVVLPYLHNGEHSVFAASGAVRIALATETPVVTSDVHLFDDVKNIVLYSKTNEEIKYNIEKVFDKQINLKDMCEKRNAFIKETSWKEVARQINNIYLTL